MFQRRDIMKCKFSKIFIFSLVFAIILGSPIFTFQSKAACTSVRMTIEALYHGVASSVKNETYYVTAYSDSVCTKAVKTKSVTLKNASSGTIMFDDLASGTYYFGESDSSGTLKKDTSDLTISYPYGNISYVTDNDSTVKELKIQNNYSSEVYFINEDANKSTKVITIIENVKNNKNIAIKSKTFYVTAYTNSACTNAVKTKSITLKNTSSGKITFDNLSPGIYHFAQSYSNGKLMLNSGNLTISYPYGNIAFVRNDDNTTRELRIQNDYSGTIKNICYHNYSSHITKATLSQDGSIVTKCYLCGHTINSQTIYHPRTIELSKTSYTYDGKVKNPSVTVIDSNFLGNKIPSSNYTVIYPSGRIDVGTYKVTIKFKGNYYSGTSIKTFKINPASVKLNSVTSTSSGKLTAKWTKNIKATGYEIKYGIKSDFSNAKTVNISNNSILSKTLSGLSKGKKYYVKVRSYKIVSGVKYYSSWSSAKSIVVKK